MYIFHIASITLESGLSWSDRHIIFFTRKGPPPHAPLPPPEASMLRRLRWRGLRTESVDDYTGVLIPLDQAHLQSHSARCGRMEYEELPDEDNDDEEIDPKDRAGDDHEETGMLEMSAAEYSVEGLRREVRRGGHGMRSDYESSFCTPGFLSFSFSLAWN